MNFKSSRNIIKYIILAFLLFLVPSPGSAQDTNIALSSGLQARAFITKGTRYEMWEKSMVVHFVDPRRVLSTNEGFVQASAIINHGAEPELWGIVCKEMKTAKEVGGKIYLRKIKEKIASRLGINAENIAQAGTAADMDNLSVITKEHKPFIVTALVTAGAKTNALRTGVDQGAHIEGEEPRGTVIIFVLTNAVLTDGAMARALITITEAKTAAFEDLHVPSSYTRNVQATGTGTDSIIVASGTSGPAVTCTGGHSKIGELMGKAVYEAVVEALGKQNGFKLIRK